MLRSVLGFLFLVVLFSWPPMTLGRLLEDPWVANAAAMLAVAAAAVVHARLSGRRLVLWSSGRPAYLLAAVAVPLAAYAPGLLGVGAGVGLAAALQFVLNLAPAWGEEAGWRSYLYGTLLGGYGEARRLLVHGTAWVLWHAPAIVGGPGDVLQLALALPVGVLHATLFAWLYRGGGVAAATVYHALYDTLRDAVAAARPGPEAGVGLAFAGLVVAAAGLAAFLSLVRGAQRG